MATGIRQCSMQARVTRSVTALALVAFAVVGIGVDIGRRKRDQENAFPDAQGGTSATNVRRSSIQARATRTITAVALVAFAVIGIGVDIGLHTKDQEDGFQDAQRVAAAWIASMKPGEAPRPALSEPVDLLQLVDSRGRVVAASRAAGSGPLSEVRPPLDGRILHLRQCSPARCLLLAAIRVSPHEARVLWSGEPHIVYAGTIQPPLLSLQRTELFIAGAVLAAVLLAAWAAWSLIGRALRPVEAIRARMAEISVTDLSLRVPEPSRDDEIGQLARTANQTLARLEQAVEQQRQFAYCVSHEFRTPVTGMRTQMEEALLYPDEVDPREAITTALCTVGRLQALIDDMLVLARIRTAVPTPPEQVDLGALVRREITGAGSAVPVDVLAEEGTTVTGNSLQLTQLLTNLVNNARRHAESRVEVSVGRDGEMAVLTVADDGAGILPEDRERIFQLFVRLSDGHGKDPRGTGLGLAICRAIVAAHHGTLTVEDASPGACFVVRLPLSPAGPPPRDPGSAGHQPTSRR
ncbi:two-component sensor histidine kinase [Sphaerisporangium melleum]|uniref:histidine kinase n=1 Tax=Sphaerisporangium melleum TaxID=321316 RepID=A0A917QWF1_9ACTN|nr:HAMP domain-containing sensor histidine kinase [Sphaerisporangium melleum]GGK71616.1 two-component sensor histidine kinase [Sphaerisporangium melleum]GII70149.1 two-component sensor histidine kinase [Sphaerisporangium melleum]